MMDLVCLYDILREDFCKRQKRKTGAWPQDPCAVRAAGVGEKENSGRGEPLPLRDLYSVFSRWYVSMIFSPVSVTVTT